MDHEKEPVTPCCDLPILLVEIQDNNTADEDTAKMMEETKQEKLPRTIVRSTRKALVKARKRLRLTFFKISPPGVPENLILEKLPQDVLQKHILSLLPRSQRFLAPVCRTFRDACEVEYEGKTETYLHGMSSVKQIEVYLEESNEHNDKTEYPSHEFGPGVAKYYVAAGTGQRDLVHWAGSRHWISCCGAARSGRLETLQWLREERRCRWNWKTCAAAEEGGHLEVLQWARANGCKLYSHASLCEDSCERGLTSVTWDSFDFSKPKAHNCPHNLLDDKQIESVSSW